MYSARYLKRTYFDALQHLKARVAESSIKDTSLVECVSFFAFIRCTRS